MNNQWLRKAELILTSQGAPGMSVSYDGSRRDGADGFRFTFRVINGDVEMPNNLAIRIYNLRPETVKQIRGEFDGVVLNAGYANGNYGAIFKGTIKQFRVGRESAVNSYLDVLAADGDVGYNQGIVNTSLAAGATPADSIKATQSAMPETTLDIAALLTDRQHVPNIRGQVLFGMARDKMRNMASTLDSTWSIQNGAITLIDRAGYSIGEAVSINVGTGMIGIPEQTDEGVRVKCLLNSRIRIGGSVKLNNSEITQTVQRSQESANVPYNRRAGVQFLAPLSPDGLYRAYVVEHEGDTRGEMWYSNLICLAIKPSAPAATSVDPR